MRYSSVFVAIAAICAAVAPAHAAPQASGWSEIMHARVRLVRGAEHDGAVYDIGVQIQLDPHWKTYWRMPGDAGIPPVFDFSASDNLAAHEVEWPAPQWFADEYGNSIGYHDEVVFPIRITAADAARPVRVEATVLFAVCLDICIPASADLVLDLDRLDATPRYAGLISNYRSEVPLPVGQVDGLAVAGVTAQTDQDGRVGLMVDIACGDARGDVGLFVEGPEPFYFGRPRDVAGAPDGHRLLLVPVTGAGDPAALSGASLNFVVVNGDLRISQPWVLP